MRPQNGVDPGRQRETRRAEHIRSAGSLSGASSCRRAVSVATMHVAARCARQNARLRYSRAVDSADLHPCFSALR